ncbi:hypothetical protein BDZ91DRAFT_254145 [Kalaharituber pfeilii]|nr:hypothetical protein BDZ91DRAFT_254145 [Kalaharituber pfeilii]
MLGYSSTQRLFMFLALDLAPQAFPPDAWPRNINLVKGHARSEISLLLNWLPPSFTGQPRRVGGAFEFVWHAKLPITCAQMQNRDEMRMRLVALVPLFIHSFIDHRTKRIVYLR